jgi:hypothetical protein
MRVARRDEEARIVAAVVLPAHGPWMLPIADYEVLQVTFAYPIDVVAYADGGASAIIRFEGPFDFTDARGGTHHLNAAEQSWADLAVVLSLRHDRVTEANATEDEATLRVAFASGCVLSAGPTPQYESWQVTGPGFQLIALPGGGVAHFSPRQ